jgi:hypothetical protein
MLRIDPKEVRPKGKVRTARQLSGCRFCQRPYGVTSSIRMCSDLTAPTFDAAELGRRGIVRWHIEESVDKRALLITILDT